MIFFLVNLILFILGTFLDMAAHHPDLHADLPADLHAIRHGPVQFGMLMLINCALGLNTPPVAPRNSSAAPSAASRWAR